MKRSLQIFLLFIIGIFFTKGCDTNSNELTPQITGIQPESGPPGTAVRITGNDFSPTPSENNIMFDSTSAPVTSATETELETEVPEGIETGPAEVEVSVDGNSAIGPSFNVESESPGISSIEPDSGAAGTEITINGMNFSPKASENSITFAGTPAPTHQASREQLVTEVPQGAVDGPVKVTVNNNTTTGPVFDVIAYGTFEAKITTRGEDQDDGYELHIDGKTFKTGANETVTVTDLQDGDYQVELTDVASNCNVNDENPRSVNVEGNQTITTNFEINCLKLAENKIVFQRDPETANDVFIMNADGSNQKNLTNQSKIFDGYPVISNSGTKIAFSSWRDGEQNVKIFIMNIDGSNVRSVTSDRSGTPSWSPDDSKLVFQDERGEEDAEIYIVDIDGSNLVQLTDNSSEEFTPVWSPNSEKIAFASDRDGDYEIYIMNTDGTGIQQLTENSSFDFDPSWSPDGSHIAFYSDRDDSNSDIYTMKSDGSSIHRITNSSADDTHPNWSPDGTELVFQTVRDGQSEIYKVNADGSGSLTNLTSNSQNDQYPFWSPVQ